MKNPCTILTYITILLTTFLISCKDESVTLSEEQIQKEKLVATWQLVSASIDNEVVTDEFLNFKLTVNDDLNYSTNSKSVERQPNPWPVGGKFAFAVNGNGTTNLNSLRRDEEMDITIGNTETTLTTSFRFDENIHSGSNRDEAINGDWVFEFEAPN